MTSSESTSGSSGVNPHKSSYEPTQSSVRHSTGASLGRTRRTDPPSRREKTPESTGHSTNGNSSPSKPRWIKLLPRLPGRYRGTDERVKRKVDRHLKQVAEFIWLSIEDRGL